MRKAIFIIICMVCIAAVISGKVYWNHKISTTAADARQQMHDEPNQVKSNTAKASGKSKKESANAKTKEGAAPNVDQLTADLPKKVADPIDQAVQDGNALHLLIVTAHDDPGWIAPLQVQLDKEYGKGVFDVTAESYGDKTTSDFLKNDSYQDLFDIPSGTDMILLESMISNDQGELSTEDTLLGTTRLRVAIQKKFPDMTFILQPPNPVYQRSYYADHVDGLRQYAKKEDILYINHWEAWPDPESQDIMDDLQKDARTPNKKGYQLWGQYLGDFFTSQLTESSD